MIGVGSLNTLEVRQYTSPYPFLYLEKSLDPPDIGSQDVA